MLRYWLYPFQWMLQIAIYLRHLCYDWGWKKAQKGKIKTLVIGNLNIGGTGKTPFSIFMIQQLSARYQLSFLSRGYGRKTKGIIKINDHHQPNEVGDEPLLIQRKNPSIPCYVGEKRVKAIEQIAQSEPQVDWVILDDAFQHRSLIPDIAIVLTKWDELFVDDVLWPVGNLRDLQSSIQRANAIVVTSTPEDLSANELQTKRKKLQTVFNGPVFFAQTTTLSLQPLFPHLPPSPEFPVGSFCGIAKPQPFFEFLSKDFSLEKTLVFSDHHAFNKQDLEKLTRELVNFGGKLKSWITTEKDAIRIQDDPHWSRMPIYFLPIETSIHPEDQKEWNQWLNQQLVK
jgi:tetraacyldisaccharide 4'-kinase